MKNQTDFSSRIGVRAVTAGVIISFTIMILLMSLIAALGLWNFYPDEFTHAGPAFWISMVTAWAISMFVAGFVASVGARSQSTVEGVLNALAACCGSYLFFNLVSLFFAPRMVESVLNMATAQFFLRVFLSGIIGFAVGVYGGVVGVHFEQHSLDAFKRNKPFEAKFLR